MSKSMTPIYESVLVLGLTAGLGILSGTTIVSTDWRYQRSTSAALMALSLYSADNDLVPGATMAGSHVANGPIVYLTQDHLTQRRLARNLPKPLVRATLLPVAQAYGIQPFGSHLVSDAHERGAPCSSRSGVYASPDACEQGPSCDSINEHIEWAPGGSWLTCYHSAFQKCCLMEIRMGHCEFGPDEPYWVPLMWGGPWLYTDYYCDEIQQMCFPIDPNTSEAERA